jgi:hypothetical protein
MSDHSLTKLYSLGFSVALLIAFTFVLLFWRVPTPIDTVTVGVRPPPEEIAGRTVVDFGTATDGVVAYSYLGDKVPGKLAVNEVPELRNETSYTTLIEAPQKEGDDATLQTIIFSQPSFAQDVDGSWKYLEYATTTEQAFRDRDRSLWQALTELVVRTAYADSISPFSGAGDGYTSASASEADGCGSTWGFEVEDIDDYTSTTGLIKGQSRVAAICTSTRARFYTPFDTSSISSGSTITAASLNVYVTAKVNNNNDGTDYATVVRTSQTTHSILQGGDYDLIGTAEGVDSGQRKDITSITTSAYLVFTINATGQGWIAKSGQASNCSATTGITCLGVREGHDNTGSEPASNATGNSVTFSTSENTGTTQDPYLSVTYTPASSNTFAPWKFNDF